MLAKLASLLCLHAPDTVRFDALHTSIDLTATGSKLSEVVLVDRSARGSILGRWTASLETCKLQIVIEALDRKTYKSLDAPADVIELIEWNRANEDRGAKRADVFSFDWTRAVPGNFGWISYAWVGVATHKLGTKSVGTCIHFAALTPEFGWQLEVEAEPALSAKQVQDVVESLRLAIAYDGPRMDPEWTDKEVEDRWRADAPKKVQEDRKLQVVRTEHYLILTVVGKGTAAGFGKEMELNYEFIRSIYPFEDVPGQRLLPIYYFQDSDEYCDFLVGKIGWSREAASRSKGVASGDWYATYHEAPTDPVHVHEATHQIFRNRLMLHGAGSWFQEGVAEYVSSTENELNAIQKLAKDGEYTPFREFFVVPSLLMSNVGERKSGESIAGLAYSQAAAVIEFVRHSTETRGKFLPWIHAVGRTARGDLPAIERATIQTLGFDLDQLQTKWVAYYKARKKVRDWHWPAKKLNK